MKRRVLVTGAAGRVATILRREWKDRYLLRLADLRPLADLSVHEEFIELDITDLPAFAAACDGIDTVVHLAADPSPHAQFFESLLQRNIIGGYNGFEAARQAGCRRVVFASSINAVLGYIQTDQDAASWDSPLYPQNVYGATKCWGEALARVYDDQHGLSGICIRLASPTFDQQSFDPEQTSFGISPRDTASVFASCVDAADDVGFAIVHGVSRHTDHWFQVSCSDPRIHFEPQDGTTFPRA